MGAFFRNLLATILGFFISLFLLFLFFIMLIAAMASFGEKEAVIEDASILRLDLSNEIPERPTDNPFAQFGEFSEDFRSPLSLKEILDCLKGAKEDDRIKGIYMDLSLLRADLATLEEIRHKLVDFKKSGKFVYAYSEMYSQSGYYLSSVADSIYLNSEGLFSFAGFHSEQIFIKGTLDKLGIEPNLIRAGKYKSAGEMFIREDMSPDNRRQVKEYVESAYGAYLQSISEARKIPVAELRRIADEGLVRFPADAVRHKLVHKTCYYDHVLAAMRRKLGVEKEKDVKFTELYEYNRREGKEAENTGKDKIALIYAVGEIGGGEGDEENIGSEGLTKAIRKARQDESVKAIVLRINSPGGGALASDVIWREVVLAKQSKKPIVVSMGDLAASGGYYIAAPADVIVSEANTITGSIGVFGLLPNLQKFWKDKLGVTWDRVNTGKFSDIGNVNRPMTTEERAIIQTYIDSTYIDFKKRVADGRKLPMAVVDSIAQGRIWSGLQAKKIGLVDRIGTLEDAIKIAAERAKLETYGIKMLPRFEKKFPFFKRGADMLVQSALRRELGEDYVLYQKIKVARQREGIMMLMPLEVKVW